MTPGVLIGLNPEFTAGLYWRFIRVGNIDESVLMSASWQERRSIFSRNSGRFQRVFMGEIDAPSMLSASFRHSFPTITAQKSSREQVGKNTWSPYLACTLFFVSALTFFRLWLCSRLQSVGDEAYYWLCSRGYQNPSLLSFYLPGRPTVFSEPARGIANQISLWPGYRDGYPARATALFVSAEAKR